MPPIPPRAVAFVTYHRNSHRFRSDAEHVQTAWRSSLPGRLIGMISTHYLRTTTLPAGELQIMARFGDLIGALLARVSGIS